MVKLLHNKRSTWYVSSKVLDIDRRRASRVPGRDRKSNRTGLLHLAPTCRSPTTRQQGICEPLGLLVLRRRLRGRGSTSWGSGRKQTRTDQSNFVLISTRSSPVRFDSRAAAVLDLTEYVASPLLS